MQKSKRFAKFYKDHDGFYIDEEIVKDDTHALEDGAIALTIAEDGKINVVCTMKMKGESTVPMEFYLFLSMIERMKMKSEDVREDLTRTVEQYTNYVKRKHEEEKEEAFTWH